MREWLHANHANAETFWLVSFKKHVTDLYIPYGEIVFDAFTKSAKKVILHWIKTAKRSDRRAKSVSEVVRPAAKGLRAAHPEAKGQ